ncbi:phage tail assembly chaperone [Devosia sp. A449]
MTMQLAPDTITITADRLVIELRPSLRAATRLARRHGTFAPLLRGILDGHIGIITDLIREGGSVGDDRLLEAIEANGLRSILGQISEPLLQFVLALAGYDESKIEEPTAPADHVEPIAFDDYHKRLFGLATGWLGWPPETAWNATPAEIIAAHQGRVEMLKAIYGGDDSKRSPATPEKLSDKVRGLMRGLGAKRAA